MWISVKAFMDLEARDLVNSPNKESGMAAGNHRKDQVTGTQKAAITKTVLASWPRHDLLTVSEEDVSCSVPWGPGVSEVINQTLHRLKQDKIRLDFFNVKISKK